MKALTFLIVIAVMAACTGCDLRSGTARAEMDKFSAAPTPSPSPVPSPLPSMLPAEIAEVDPALSGQILTVNGEVPKASVTCSSFDRVMINGSGIAVTVRGVCRQIMINGDRNEISADAAAELVFNGTGNELTYARYVNGKLPMIKENQLGNNIDKASRAPQGPVANKKK